MNTAGLRMASLLPPWMSIRKNPDATVGGSVLDAIGAQIEDLENVVSGVLLMKHPAASPWRSDGSLRIQGIDLLAIDWINVYDVPSALKTDAPVVRRSNGVVVPLADSVFDFYRFENSEAAYQDLNEPKLYTRMDLGVVSYNGVELLPSRPQSVWGPYDEIGLLIGCPRLPDEHNPEYRLRLTTAWAEPGSSTREGMRTYIARSLGIQTRDVRMTELSDERMRVLTSMEDGGWSLPDEIWEFLRVAEEVNSVRGDSYWATLDSIGASVVRLPIPWINAYADWRWDEISSGIGYGDDWKVDPPEQVAPTQTFTYVPALEGLQRTTLTTTPQVEFDYVVQATGEAAGENGVKPEAYQYTLRQAELVPVDLSLVAESTYKGVEPRDCDDEDLNPAWLKSPHVSVLTADPFLQIMSVDPLCVEKEAGTDTWLDLLVDFHGEYMQDTMVATTCNQVVLSITRMDDSLAYLTFSPISEPVESIDENYPGSSTYVIPMKGSSQVPGTSGIMSYVDNEGVSFNLSDLSLAGNYINTIQADSTLWDSLADTGTIGVKTSPAGLTLDLE